MDAFTPAELATVQRFLAATTTAMATYRASLASAPRQEGTTPVGQAGAAPIE